MKFGVFDHVDRGDVPLREHYENRLLLAEVYDREGFYAYLIAEHHSTPLGTAGAPGVFLSAVAQRTKRLRIGTLVYTLPLVNPLRLLEEVCMLDQMSGGRLELGVGRGSSPYELAYFGVTAEASSTLYKEGYAVLMQGLQSKTIDFEGQHSASRTCRSSWNACRSRCRRSGTGCRRPPRCRGRRRTASTSSAIRPRRTSARSPTVIARSGAATSRAAHSRTRAWRSGVTSWSPKLREAARASASAASIAGMQACSISGACTAIR